jgi:two-component system, LytTR family, response regulator
LKRNGMLKVLIADDEASARSRLKRLLADAGDVGVIGEAEDGLKALEAAAKLRPDALFLDIEMPGLNGLGVAEALGGKGPAVVFVTAFRQHALKAFELAAADYLVKPVKPERLAESLERLRKGKAKPPDLDRLSAGLGEKGPRRMAVKSGNRYLVFDPSRVAAVLARDHYAALLVDGKELLADDGLEALAQRLDAERFVRVHRGAAVNLDFLKSLESEGEHKYTAVLSDAASTRLPVSRERVAELKKRLGLAG